MPADTRLAGSLEALDRVTFGLERPVRRLVGSNRLNPLPQAGTISVFLLGVVILTGLYITLFFQFGTEAAYQSVTAMEGHAIQKVVRALHRYASAALVLTTLVHAWRIFVGARFTGRPRRWRWASGVAALVIMWLAGVTGYWLVQDIRAQALSDATVAVLSDVGVGLGLAVRDLSGVGPGSGAGLVLLVWFAHLGLTAVVGWFLFRHLRRSTLPWLPPRHWMILMGVALLLVSLALPVGMLPPASPERLAGDMPLDPFVLFLLPPLLSSWRWLAVAIGLVVLVVGFFLPRLLRRADPAPARIDADACTGCELCAVDCPYHAITMAPAGSGPVGSGLAGEGGVAGIETGEPGAQRQRMLAVVNPEACVACGICVGSCAFGAVALPGLSGLAPTGEAGTPVTLSAGSVVGRNVVVACDRHASLSGGTLEREGAADDRVVLRVRCAGMFAPGAVTELMANGATGVHLVGCPPHDCRYGVGNRLAAERLAGERSPHPPRRWMASIEQDWVAPTELAGALAHPGAHPSADDSRLPGRRDVLAGAGVLVALSVLAVVFATRAPFGGTEAAGVRVVVDHVVGRSLLPATTGSTTSASPPAATSDAGPTAEPVAAIDRIEVRMDGVEVASAPVAVDGDRSLGLVDVRVEPGAARFEVVARSGDRPITVFDAPVDLTAGRRLVVSVADVPPPPGVEEGADLFTARSSGCTVCHSVERGDDGVGPSLHGVASAAGTRVEGLTAELYLRNSILLPDQYVLEGWPAGQMLPIYREKFSEEQLDALIAYLMTLTDEPGSAPAEPAATGGAGSAGGDDGSGS